MTEQTPHPAFLMRDFLMKVRAFASSHGKGDQDGLLTAACKLRVALRAVLDPLKTAFETDDCKIMQACEAAMGRLQDSLDVAGQAWLRKLMAEATGDSAESIEAKANEILCDPTPTLADAIAAVKIKGDLEAIAKASVGACFQELVEVMPLYTKVNSMKQDFLDDESKAICATFSNKVDASMAEAFVTFQGSFKQLTALNEKYECLVGVAAIHDSLSEFRVMALAHGPWALM